MFRGIGEMKKIVDDDRLIYKVCCLYYEDGMNHKEIGDYLGVSRSSVLRMLQKPGPDA